MIPEGIPGAVLDCVIYLQGAVSDRGPARAVLDAWEAGAFRLFVSKDLLAEIEDVLSRPKLQRKWLRLTPRRVHILLQRLRKEITLIDPVSDLFRYPRDPDDEPVVNLALDAGADYLVTWDADLLVSWTQAARREQPSGRSFRN